jgi:TonB family protein
MKSVAISLLLLLLSVSAQSQQLTDEARFSKFTYNDWKPVGKAHFDTPPTPVGGMHSLFSRMAYPPVLALRRVGGLVKVRASFDSTGRVLEVKVVESSAGPALNGVVVDAIRYTRWNPAMKNHSPIAATFTLPVTFTPPR